MKRLTDKRLALPPGVWQEVTREQRIELQEIPVPSKQELYYRLFQIEEILCDGGDEYDLDRLRELAEADRLIGMTVYESNKRGFISTYEVISVHISKCSILVGWNLLDGVYSNLNGFEISALGKSIFLTREEAEAALKVREQE